MTREHALERAEGALAQHVHPPAAAQARLARARVRVRDRVRVRVRVPFRSGVTTYG